MKSISMWVRAALCGALVFSGQATWADQAVVAARDNWVSVSPQVCKEEWRSDDELRYCSAVGDFDGDGVPDRAQLILKQERVGVAVWLSSARAQDQPVSIFSSREIAVSLRDGTALGIEKLAPGVYGTLCGKGYSDCARGEPRSISIRTDAILLFKEGSWGDIAYLDSQSRLSIFGTSD